VLKECTYSIFQVGQAGGSLSRGRYVSLLLGHLISILLCYRAFSFCKFQRRLNLVHAWEIQLLRIIDAYPRDEGSSLPLW
jgi:hypothetical protein